MPARELISFQGELGAFSQQAVHQLLGEGTPVRPCQHFEEIFSLLDQGKVTGAVVPIENTLHGSVHENYDHLLAYKLPIVAETKVRIVHNLIAAPGVKFPEVEEVYSHPVALNQCRQFFAANPQVRKVPYYDTAGSVKMIMEERPARAAAIASAFAAEIYQARILRRSIEDDRQNYTRFFLLRRPAVARRRKLPPPGQGDWKTSLVFITRNVPGALFRCISAFALRDLNLTKLESRPLRGKPWEYLFYLDFLGDIRDTRSKNALQHLAELTDFLRILGCYPRGER